MSFLDEQLELKDMVHDRVMAGRRLWGLLLSPPCCRSRDLGCCQSLEALEQVQLRVLRMFFVALFFKECNSGEVEDVTHWFLRCSGSSHQQPLLAFAAPRTEELGRTDSSSVGSYM